MTPDEIAKIRSFYSAAERNDVDHVQADSEPGYRFDIEHAFRCDGHVVVLGQLDGTAKKTGREFHSPFAHVWTLDEDGRASACRYHVDTGVLLGAFGDGDGQADGAALDVVMGVYAATGRGDREGVVALLDPEVDWKIPDELPYGGRFKGPDGVMKSRAIANEHFVPGQKFTPRHVFQSADRIVGIGTMEAVVAASEERVAVPFVHVWKVRDDKVVARRQYTDTEAILSALG